MARFCLETSRELGRRGHRLTAFTGHQGRQCHDDIPVFPVLRGDLSLLQFLLSFTFLCYYNHVYAIKIYITGI